MEKKDKQKTIAEVVCGALSGIIMIICVLVYLIVGFTVGAWHPYWLIIVGGGLFTAIMNIIAGLVKDVKQIKANENKKDEE